MKIEYKIEEVRPNVFAVIVKDHYHRAMLFCRVQEYYESPNPKFSKGVSKKKCKALHKEYKKVFNKYL